MLICILTITNFTPKMLKQRIAPTDWLYTKVEYYIMLNNCRILGFYKLISTLCLAILFQHELANTMTSVASMW